MGTNWELNAPLAGKPSASQTSDLVKIAGDLFQIGFKGLNDAMNLLKTVNFTPMPDAKGGNKCGCAHCCPDPWIDCLPCGPLTSTTDIKLEGRFGESRIASILLENNTQGECKFKVGFANFMDGCGQKIDPGNVIQASPMEGSIPPCSCKKIGLMVNLLPPFKPSQVYYGEIRLDTHCDSKVITFGIWIKPDTLVDYLALCNPCYPQKGKLIEVAACDCGCGCCIPARTLYACPSGKKADSTHSN
jgi:hypothetical protein